MRIKLNLMQLTPDRDPSLYWIYIDITYISLIKQLKEKVKRVLKETRDIDLCVDNVKFLDEDDIHVINENEEITVIPREKKRDTQLKIYETHSVNTNIVTLNGIVPTKSFNFTPANDSEQLSSSMSSGTSKKRVRKRTHKKKNKQIEPVENNCLIVEVENSIKPFEEPSRIHKRYKLNNEDIEQQDNCSFSETSASESLYVTREIVRCDSSHSNVEIKNHIIQPGLKNEKPLKTKITKVPIFVRTPKNSTQNNSYSENENNRTCESNDEDEECDVLVVDWKNMTPIKITNVNELQVYDMIQFKILSFNDDGEAAISSTITSRIEYINGSSLLVQVLSGIKEFMIVNQKFSIHVDEEIGTKREVEFEDLIELVKLI